MKKQTACAVGLCLFLLLAFPGVSIAKDLTPEELVEIGGQREEARVTWAGTYNFFVEDEGGKKLEILWGDGGTEFFPEDYRPSKGDVVNLVYFTPYNASNSNLKHHARYVKLVKIGYKNEIPELEWLEAVLAYPKFRGANSIFLTEYKKLIAVEGSLYLQNMDDMGREQTVGIHEGERFMVKLKKVPQNPGSSNVYVVTSCKGIEQ